MPQTIPQHTDGDSRIASALDEQGVNYRIDEDGDYRVVFELEDGRSHSCFIRSSTYEFAGIELREVFSVGLMSMGPFDARTTHLLLQLNSDVALGAWSTRRDSEDNHWAFFGASVPAELTGEPLMHIVYAILTTADKVEERLSGRDDF